MDKIPYKGLFFMHLPSHTLQSPHVETPSPVDTNGLFTLPDTDSDPNPGMDICPKDGYSNDKGSESELT